MPSVPRDGLLFEQLALHQSKIHDIERTIRIHVTCAAVRERHVRNAMEPLLQEHDTEDAERTIGVEVAGILRFSLLMDEITSR